MDGRGTTKWSYLSGAERASGENTMGRSITGPQKNRKRHDNGKTGYIANECRWTGAGFHGKGRSGDGDGRVRVG